MYTFRFPAFMFPEFSDKLEKLNKRLAKMDNTHQVTVLERKQEQGSLRIEGEAIDVLFDEVTISDPVVTKFPDITYVGTVNFHGDATTIFTIGNENVAHLDLKPTRCDHCNTNRKRVRSNIFRKDNGSYLVVGFTCSEDFTGVKINSALNTFLKFIDKVNDDDPAKVKWDGVPVFRSNFQKVVSAILMTHAHNPTYIKHDTAYTVKDNIYSKEAKQYEGNVDDVRQKLLTRFGKTDPTTSNFNNNLVNGLFYHVNGQNTLRDFIPHKCLGIYTWAVYEALKAPKVPSNRVNSFIGSIGETISVEGIVTRTRECTSQWGTSMMVVADTKQGEITFFTQKKFAFKLVQGDAIKVTGKVKEHKNYKGFNSTQMNYISPS